MFKKATKEGSLGRLALCGVTGGGKTYTAMKIATYIARQTGKRFAVVDTERGSARKYSDEFDFDVLELDRFAPSLYREAIKDASNGQYCCLIIDSLSHAWAGKDGVLQYKDAVAEQRGKNSYTAWREAGEEQNALMDAILEAPIHVIVTMRSKMEYIQETDERTNKTVIRKVGLAPVQRDGLEYEFDLVCDMMGARLVVGKTRCSALFQRTFKNAGDDFAEIYWNWLCGTAPTPQATPEPVPAAEPLESRDVRFKQACEAAGLDPRAEAEALTEKHNAGWAALMDMQVEARIREIWAAAQPNVDTAAPVDIGDF